jgi:hypothetical protein
MCIHKIESMGSGEMGWPSGIRSWPPCACEYGMLDKSIMATKGSSLCGGAILLCEPVCEENRGIVGGFVRRGAAEGAVVGVNYLAAHNGLPDRWSTGHDSQKVLDVVNLSKVASANRRCGVGECGLKLGEHEFAPGFISRLHRLAAGGVGSRKGPQL